MRGGWKRFVRSTHGTPLPGVEWAFDRIQDLRRAWAGPLAEPPEPWLDPDRKLMVLWSAKCACTASFVWFAKCVGMLDEMRALGKQPHRYRQENYHRSELYRRGRAAPIKDYYVVHIIRDPYLRAVSSYRHALGTGYADKRLALPQAGGLNRAAGFSFAEFLNYLETIDLRRANVHHRLQRHPVEKSRPPDRVINISRQDLFAELNRLEADRSLPRTDFASLEWLHRREAERRAQTEPIVGPDIPERRFNAAAVNGRRPWPDYEQFLDDRTRHRIERLYAPDFELFAPYL